MKKNIKIKQVIEYFYLLILITFPVQANEIWVTYVEQINPHSIRNIEITLVCRSNEPETRRIDDILWFKDEETLKVNNTRVIIERVAEEERRASQKFRDVRSRILIPQLLDIDEGNYTCQEKSGPEESEIASPHQLKLYCPAEVNLKPSGEISIAKGETLELECFVSKPGYPLRVEAIQFYHDNNLLDIRNDSRLTVQQFNLKIHNMQEEDKGFYYCRIQNFPDDTGWSDPMSKPSQNMLSVNVKAGNLSLTTIILTIVIFALLIVIIAFIIKWKCTFKKKKYSISWHARPNLDPSDTRHTS